MQKREFVLFNSKSWQGKRNRCWNYANGGLDRRHTVGYIGRIEKYFDEVDKEIILEIRDELQEKFI